MNIVEGSAEAKMICNALRTSYTWAGDALCSCAGVPYGYSRRRREPNYAQANKNIEYMKMIERVCEGLGFPIDSHGRESSEAYFNKHAKIWEEFKEKV